MSAYNCILERPFSTTMGAIASLIHLKLKYYNVHDDAGTINANLSMGEDDL